MDELIYSVLSEFSTLLLIVVTGVSLYVLGKGADILVDGAVALSFRWNVPEMIVGATIVSLGTTLPEMTVSVFAAIKGNPDLALGNAIGSITTNSALIIGCSALVGTLIVEKSSMVRQSRIQLLTSGILTLFSLPWLSGGVSGRITQWMGYVFLLFLVIYIIRTIQSAKNTDTEIAADYREDNPLILQLIKLILGVILVIFASEILIPSVEITALRVGIPSSVIAATLVALGTSLPEFVTAITAVRRGHGELAVGNVVGANILNLLFVTGSAAAVTRDGLIVPESFYRIQIPAMLIALGVFHISIKNKDNKISKFEGFILLVLYIVYIALNYFWV